MDDLKRSSSLPRSLEVLVIAWLLAIVGLYALAKWPLYVDAVRRILR